MGQTSFRTSRTWLVVTCFGLAVAGILAGGVILVLLGISLFGLLGFSITPLSQLVLSLVAIQGLGFPLVAVLYFRYTGRSLRSFVPVSLPSLRELGLSLGAWIAAIVITPAVAAIVIALANDQPASNAAGESCVASRRSGGARGGRCAGSDAKEPVRGGREGWLVTAW